jgi:diguanylate cyclase (GGDEF)-like protein/PAS domain S-box-containing protein
MRERTRMRAGQHVGRLLAGVPLIVKVGLPVMAVSIGSAALLQRATTAEVLSQCRQIHTAAGSLCSDGAAIRAIGTKVALLAADVTAVTLLALWLVFHAFVLRPAGRLARAAARVADGDLSVRLGVEHQVGVRDELRVVTVEFDRMVRTVAQNQRQIRSIVDTAYDAFVSADMEGRVLDWNRRAEQLFGWTRQEALGRDLADLIVPDRYRSQHREGRAAVAGGAASSILGRPIELPALCRNGTEVPVELVIWLSQVDGDRRFNSFLRDISERKQMEAQLAHQAFHDALTGLANRTLFQDRLQHALLRRGEGVAVLFCDLDDFKTVNDSLGHLAGDQLLLVVAERLGSCLRPSDTLARLAGDEFAVLLEDVGDAEVDAIAARILAALAPPVLLDGREVIAHASLGVATTVGLVSGDQRPDEAEDVAVKAETLMRNADAAMYAAKRRGKDTVERFLPSMHEQAVQRLRLRAELHRSLQRHELRLDYQPYVDAVTGRIVGCEALVRWDHPTRGLVSPGEFMPLAEETGFIRDLGRWVLREACAQLAAWRRHLGPEPELAMNVNVSFRQLEDPAFVGDVVETLRATGVDPASVVLEVTESVLSNELDVGLQRLRELKDIGVGIALDDFGTGYSSLGQLRHIPVDIVKIDRSFVTPLGNGVEADASVIQAIMSISKSRNLRTVAEGVETPEQLAALRALGCDHIQGFLFHRPIAPDLVKALLQAQAGVSSWT